MALGSGTIVLSLNGFVAKPDPENPICPTLDPTASIQISDELIGIYQSRIDALINQLGKHVILQFRKIKNDCPNCGIDIMRGRSDGIYTIGGPRPFGRGQICPWCKGSGFEETDNLKCIIALLKWNPRDAKNYGIRLRDRKSVLRIKTFLTYFNDLRRTQTAMADGDSKVKLINGPYPVGLREDRYCISFWELLED